MEERLPRRSRTVIMVGPGRHFGLELVRRFIDGGFRVAVLSRSGNELSDTRSFAGGHLTHAQADISDPHGFSRGLIELADRLGQVDGLIYNPRADAGGKGLATRPLDLEASLSVSVTGAMIAVQTLLPRLKATKGTVVLTGGGYKDRPDSAKLALSVGKAGIHALYQTMRQPLRLEGVQIKTIVIDGAVRRSGIGHPASALAEFYWRAFMEDGGRAHHFPAETQIDEQLPLFA